MHFVPNNRKAYGDLQHVPDNMTWTTEREEEQADVRREPRSILLHLVRWEIIKGTNLKTLLG